MTDVPNPNPEAPPGFEWVPDPRAVLAFVVLVLLLVLFVGPLIRPWLRHRRIDIQNWKRHRRLRRSRRQGRDGWTDGTDSALVPPDDPDRSQRQR